MKKEFSAEMKHQQDQKQDVIATFNTKKSTNKRWIEPQNGSPGSISIDHLV
jgi:hypothetical protein